jgi:hypothetical protein
MSAAHSLNSPASRGLPSPHAAVALAYQGQPLLAGAGILLLLATIPTLAALGLDGRTLNGINVWIKPLKFEVSLALHLLSVAWLMLFLPERQGRLVRGLAYAMAGAAFFEIAYIALQASRGEASHFNVGTPITGLLYTLMGIGAVTLVATSGWLGALILRHGQTSRPIVFAAGLGLVLGSALGGLLGAYMSSQPGHWVGGEATDRGGLPVFGWSRTGGDLRVAHFVGLHLIQAVPLAAWIGAAILPDRLQKPAIVAVAAVGSLVALTVFIQALSGLPFLPRA